MTIRLTVKNEDSGEDRVITAEQQNTDGTPIPGIPAKSLKGGESAEFYVHSTNHVVVKEESRGPAE